MLLIIIGMAVVLTMVVTAAESRHQENYSAGSTANTAVASPAASATPPRVVLQSANSKTAFYSLSYIPAGSTIVSKQVQAREINELELWDDAALLQSDVVGGVARHAIPSNAQIRKSDLQ
jgi:flagella basal body P-ring formation protein FlgA